MEREIKEILNRYNAGEATDRDMEKIESMLEEGLIDIADITAVQSIHDQVVAMPTPEPSEGMTSKFYETLNEKIDRSSSFSFTAWLKASWQVQPGFQWAYTVLILVVGLLGGLTIANNGNNGKSEIKELSAEVTQMKEMIMLNLLEKESISDRLKAVNLTSELPGASGKVTEALLQTLNNDENVNVRLATLEALYPYAGDPKVRQGLIKSIAHQDSPLVQVALAELMVALQEKRSVEELEEILKKEETPYEVKERIRESIKVLI